MSILSKDTDVRFERDLHTILQSISDDTHYSSNPEAATPYQVMENLVEEFDKDDTKTLHPLLLKEKNMVHRINKQLQSKREILNADLGDYEVKLSHGDLELVKSPLDDGTYLRVIHRDFKHLTLFTLQVNRHANPNMAFKVDPAHPWVAVRENKKEYNAHFSGIDKSVWTGFDWIGFGIRTGSMSNWASASPEAALKDCQKALKFTVKAMRRVLKDDATWKQRADAKEAREAELERVKRQREEQLASL